MQPPQELIELIRRFEDNENNLLHDRRAALAATDRLMQEIDEEEGK
jgi:hypothetical protein